MSGEEEQRIAEERIEHIPIGERPKLVLPHGARVAVCVVPNIEHYEFVPARVGSRDPWPRTPHPDILGYGLRDYGNRIGVWRLFRVFDRLGIRCTACFSAAAFERFPELLAACQARDWDYIGHGVYNTRYHWDLSEDEERAEIADCVETFRRLTGRQLLGWFSPSATYTCRTPDLVAEAGMRYTCDFHFDDEPVPLQVAGGRRLVALPYQMDLNDSALLRGGDDGADYAQIARDMFDTLYEEGAESGRVMSVVVHPFIMGRPHRIRHLEAALRYIASHEHVWFATGSEIVAWYEGQVAAGPEVNATGASEP